MRQDIPLGTTRDAQGNELTFKDSTGYWEEYTRDAQGNELTFEDSTGYWYEYTFDANGRVLTFKDNRGSWFEYTRDANGNELTYKNSKGVRRGFPPEPMLTTQQQVLARIKLLEDRYNQHMKGKR